MDIFNFTPSVVIPAPNSSFESIVVDSTLNINIFNIGLLAIIISLLSAIILIVVIKYLQQ
jgi:hypothetical protein